jgi:hypothetical protein
VLVLWVLEDVWDFCEKWFVVCLLALISSSARFVPGCVNYKRRVGFLAGILGHFFQFPIRLGGPDSFTSIGHLSVRLFNSTGAEKSQEF